MAANVWVLKGSRDVPLLKMKIKRTHISSGSAVFSSLNRPTGLIRLRGAEREGGAREGTVKQQGALIMLSPRSRMTTEEKRNAEPNNLWHCVKMAAARVEKKKQSYLFLVVLQWFNTVGIKSCWQEAIKRALFCILRCMYGRTKMSNYHTFSTLHALFFIHIL